MDTSDEKSVSVRLSDSLLRRLRRIAIEQRRSLNAQIVWLLEQAAPTTDQGRMEGFTAQEWTPYLRQCAEPAPALTDAYYVYALIDPRDWTVGYVGTTHRAEMRLAAHLKLSDGNGLKNAWLRGLLAVGVTPWMRVLETVAGPDDRHLASREAWWIDEALAHGMPLTNGIPVQEQGPRTGRGQ